MVCLPEFCDTHLGCFSILSCSSINRACNARASPSSGEGTKCHAGHGLRFDLDWDVYLKKSAFAPDNLYFRHTTFDTGPHILCVGAFEAVLASVQLINLLSFKFIWLRERFVEYLQGLWLCTPVVFSTTSDVEVTIWP